jgi:glycosyltransferase involved in cell wall biosynthesis
MTSFDTSIKKNLLRTESVAAIVTAMTDEEQFYLSETLYAIIRDAAISKILVCVSENNLWINHISQSLISDPRIEILRLPVLPIGAVRNKAIERISEEWVAFCDGDDVWYPNKTIAQLEFALLTKADLVGSGHLLINEKGSAFAYGLARYIPMPSSWLVRTESVRQNPFLNNTYSGSDGKWWIATHEKIRKVKYPEVLLKYRVRSNSVSSLSPSKKRKELLENLSRIPGIGILLYYSSYLAWLCTRNKPFRWMKKWNSLL